MNCKIAANLFMLVEVRSILSRSFIPDHVPGLTSAMDGTKVGESAKKKSAIAMIFHAKSKGGKDSAPGTGSHGKGGAKGGIKVERTLKGSTSSDDDEEDVKENLKPRMRRRPDGRPVLLCRIPINAIKERPPLSTGKTKRERRTSLSSSSGTTPSNSNLDSSSSFASPATTKAGKKAPLKRSPDGEAVESVVVKTEATSLGSLPGSSSKHDSDDPFYNGSASGSSSSLSHRSLMPPPNKKKYYGGGNGNSNSSDSEMPLNSSLEEEESAMNMYMEMAKKLKHEADREVDRERQALKYLEAVLHFILCGHNHEVSLGMEPMCVCLHRLTGSFFSESWRPSCRVDDVQRDLDAGEVCSTAFGVLRGRRRQQVSHPQPPVPEPAQP